MEPEQVTGLVPDMARVQAMAAQVTVQALLMEPEQVMALVQPVLVQVLLQMVLAADMARMAIPYKDFKALMVRAAA